MEDDASFGHWLTRRRQSMHIQRTELAARIGCAVVTLQKIEADERRPSRQLAGRLADHLTISLHEREIFIRVARGELLVDRLGLPQPTVVRPTNLPRPTTALAGRTREVMDIHVALARTEVRLLTLTGAPGVGKTRLALEAATMLHNVFADGIFLVELVPLSEPDLVLAAIAHALHVGISGRQPLDERLGRYLQTRRVLLLLDNFEHVLPAAPHLSRLLSAAPQLKLLITSRVALEISGEHRFTVLPLATPPAAVYHQRAFGVAGVQERYAAVDLFVQCARAVMSSFVLTDVNLHAVGEICRRLDGLPLAIELAAARAALFTPSELLAQLDNRLAFLTSRTRDLPTRHTTLEHALDWSYSLLGLAEQRLFRRLSVFVDGCTIAAAQTVCNGDGALGNTVVDTIATLEASSLLQRHEGTDGRSRFGMLETIREYALSQLVASGEDEMMQQRHVAHYLALAEATEHAWDRPDEWEWLRQLVSVHNNLRVALRWTIETRNAAMALRLNAALFSFWTTCSSLNEARGWIDAALALPHPSHTPELITVEAKVLNVAGYVAAELADHAQAMMYFERGLVQYRALGDARGSAWSIRGCAFVHMLRDEYTEAEQLNRESLRICQSSGDTWGLAWSLYAQAFVLLAQGDLMQARPALEAALVPLRQQGIVFGVLRTLLALGHTLLEQGDLAGAAERFREGLALSQASPLLTFITIGLDGLAMVAATSERPIRAARLWGAAEALREATDERRWHVFQHAYDHAIAAARSQLAELDWMIAWAAGRDLTAAQAVMEALEDADMVGSSDRLRLVDRDSC